MNLNFQEIWKKKKESKMILLSKLSGIWKKKNRNVERKLKEIWKKFGRKKKKFQEIWKIEIVVKKFDKVVRSCKKVVRN